MVKITNIEGVEVSNSVEGLQSMQNILRKIKKSSKVRQNQKTLISFFRVLLRASVKNLFLQGN